MEILKEIFMCLFWITGILLALFIIFAIIQTFLERLRPKINVNIKAELDEIEKEVDEVIEKIFKDKEDK